MRGERGGTHNHCSVYARADDFDTHFGVVLDDLLALFHTRRLQRRV